MRVVVAMGLLLLFAGCGRPATEQECEEIVGRITELELRARGMTASDRSDEVEQTKQALRKSTLRECVGRRISDKALACVRQAKTSQQITECF